jgi:hypothetical protein
MFIATHSADILRGVLDANSPAVKVVRIRRDGAANSVRLLDNARIGELWRALGRSAPTILEHS